MTAISLLATDMLRDRFVPTMLYVRETGGMHTRLCVYNYFSELYPAVTSGATVWMWFFDQAGNTVGNRQISLGFRGQLQFEVADLGVAFEGTVGLSLVPDTLPVLDHSRRVATGFYAVYHDDQGHADMTHEWDPMRFEPARSAPWLCVVRPIDFPDTEIIVMNACYGDDSIAGAGQWSVRLRSGNGKILEQREMPPLPVRGSMRTHVTAMFPNVGEHARRERTVAVEVFGTNIQGPFTFVKIPGGDFNIHHFC